MALNDNIADALVSHQIGLQRLSNATVRKIVALLSRADARIVERLLREDLSQISRSRQAALLADLRRIIDSVYEDVTGQLQIELERLAEYEVDYQADMFRRLLPIDYDTVRPGPNQIIAAVNSRPFQGRLLREWYSNLAETARRRLRETVRQGIVEGQTIDQLVRVVRGTRANAFADGILAIDRRNAEAVVRTAVNHTANRAREELYKRNKGLIKGFQMVATLDLRTSARCRAVDNAVAIADGYSRRDFGNDVKFLADVPSFVNGSRPPFHINCRTVSVPVVKSLREVRGEGDAGARASMNGQVAGDMTYSAWLRRQPVSVQNEVLGVKRAKLFRRGEIDADRFIDRTGREYSLEELRERERTAWEKAGLDAEAG